MWISGYLTLVGYFAILRICLNNIGISRVVSKLLNYIMNKKQYRELGKAGAEKRWASRHQVLIELSAYGDKEYQNQIMKWPTKALVLLLETLKSTKK